MLGKKILAQNQTDFRKDCNTDPASPCLDLNVILQMIIYLDFCSFFLLVLFTLKEGLLSNCYQIINLIKPFSDLSTTVLVVI